MIFYSYTPEDIKSYKIIKSVFYSKRRLINLTFCLCIIIVVFSSISCKSLDTEDSTESMIHKVRLHASPYDNVHEVPGKMPDGFFDNMDADELVEWIIKGFDDNPPVPGICPQRELLFTAMDVAAIASDESVRNRGINNRRLLRTYHLEFSPLVRLRIDSDRKVLRELQNRVQSDDPVIYKMYNEGVVICAPGVCFGVDIFLHPENHDLAPEFAEMLDGLFITHTHFDHYCRILSSEFEKANKPVILPEDDILVPFGGKLISGELGSVGWIAFRGGHLSMAFSSFYLFQIGEWRILHSGDNTVWIDFARSEYAKDIDVFFLKPESIYIENGERIRGGIQDAMEETLSLINARMVIPHHLLELGHGLGAYGHDMGLRLNSQVPEETIVQMLNWGDSITLFY